MMLGGLEKTDGGIWAPSAAVQERIMEYGGSTDVGHKAEEYVDIVKSMGFPGAHPLRPPKSRFYDPLSLMHSMGYKDRRYSISYTILRRISRQLSIMSAVINTRLAQMASFCSPFRLTGTMGFAIKHKDPDHKITKADVKRILELENFVANCGRPRRNKFSNKKRLRFEAFTRAYMRDSMELDQGTFEIVPDRKKRPFEVIPTDAATHRIAAEDSQLGHNFAFGTKQPMPPAVLGMSHFDREKADRALKAIQQGKGRVAYIQLLHGQIENVYSEDELSFGIRNPRTSIEANSYGYPEAEQTISIITSHLFAEQYNRNAFKQGIPKGMMNLKGDSISPEQFEGFKRQFESMVAGVANSHVMPILQADDLQWIPFMAGNKEMEFQAWIEYLLRIICGVWLIDPAEINFDSIKGGGGDSGAAIFETNNEWRIKKSRDRGLRPLLRFYSERWNEDVIDHIDDRYYLDFIGLDELTQKERMEIRHQEATLFRTLNETRSAEDLSSYGEDGNIILNPTLIQYKQLQLQEAQMQMQMEQQQQAMQAQQQAAQTQPPEQEDAGGAEEESGQEDAGGAEEESGEAPEGEFSKAFSNDKFIEIELDGI